MNDAAFVGGLQCLRDLPRNGQCFVQREATTVIPCDPLGKRLALDQLDDSSVETCRVGIAQRYGLLLAGWRGP